MWFIEEFCGEKQVEQKCRVTSSQETHQSIQDRVVSSVSIELDKKYVQT